MRTLFALVVVLVLGLMTLFFLDRAGIPITPHDRAVDKLVARNVAARGGDDAWRAVESLRLSGRMDLGQGMHVPYVLEQKRPGKMCLEFEFDGETAIQCADGETGWKIIPFRGRTEPEPMTEQELREAAGSADPYGLLFDYAARGHEVELLGREEVAGREAFKLKVTLPGGAVRWMYLDAESALEVKLEAVRNRSGREERVETFYSDWQPVEGLLIPRRQETRIVGTKDLHFLTVERVNVNPLLEDSRFVFPAGDGAATGADLGELPAFRTAALGRRAGAEGPGVPPHRVRNGTSR